MRALLTKEEEDSAGDEDDTEIVTVKMNVVGMTMAAIMVL